ncbi:phage integrase family protein [Proteiniborus sp. DW1]|uniref:tyrosine-type recombinase/integrase n=1 Tax=Proteiniborus sp. DW1 TaxID=1889883 RepID=UPI00092DFD16|nr:tyrosine-type recombinase/integrase [Proteiniborus sp. DW1]SCG82096.1 phage integrase family protein [Proteiniborus sp. DW1]
MVKKIGFNNKTNKDIDSAFKDFIRYCRVKNLSDATLTYYENTYKTFREFYKGKLEEIKDNVIDDYILYLRQNTKMNDISINTSIRGIRVILYYFMKLGYIDKFKITISKAEKKIKETYTDAELELLLKKPDIKECNFADYRTWVIINFLLATGARANTICNITIKDLNLQDSYVVYRSTKNKRQQIVPLTNSEEPPNRVFYFRREIRKI